MRKHVIAVLVLLVVSADAPQRAEAGAFATEVTQILNHAQLVLAYIRQGLQLENELAMYANMLRNTKNLSPQKFGAIQADINALAQIVQGGQALAYSLGNLDQLLRTTFPGYGRTPTVYYANYQKWSQTTLDTTLGALRAAGLQGQQLQSEQSVINSLESMSQTADGQMQALNVLGQMSDQQVQSS
jgi:type IV secretion system protein TrbJ